MPLEKSGTIPICFEEDGRLKEMGDRAHLVHHHRHNKKTFLITTESIELKLIPNLRHLKAPDSNGRSSIGHSLRRKDIPRKNNTCF